MGKEFEVRTSFIKSFVFMAVLATVGAFFPAGAFAQERRFQSPTGRYEVTFTELEHKRFQINEMKKGDEFISRALHRIDFYAKGASSAAAIIQLHDVYGWEVEARPATPQELFDTIRWSPDDGMAAFGEEGWASAPGTPTSRIINLNPSNPWKEAFVQFDEFIYLDNARFIGGYHNDCDYGVAVFDGSTGLVVPVLPSESPVGYELVAISGDVVTARRVNDNCAVERQPPSCLTMNIRSGVASPLDRCP